MWLLLNMIDTAVGVHDDPSEVNDFCTAVSSLPAAAMTIEVL